MLDPDAIPDPAAPSETNPPGLTLYLKIDLGGGLPAMTGVYLPDKTALGPLVDVILYLHGNKDTFTTIKEYFVDPRFRLRQEMAPSSSANPPRKKGFVFVAPSLAASVGAAPWDKVGTGFNYLQQVMNGLEKYLPLSTPAVGDIVLGAHSGGGMALKAIVKDPFFQKFVKEIWCFDCLYDYMMDPSKFVLDNWKKVFGHERHRIWFYSTGHVPGRAGGEGGTITQAKIMEKAATGVPANPGKPGTPGLPNIDVTITGPWKPHNITPSSHDNVPVSCLAKLIETSAILV
jgi:hypothetical protein